MYQHIHIVFGDSAHARLRVTLPKNSRIFVQRDLLAFGKIHAFHTQEQWLKIRVEQSKQLYQLNHVYHFYSGIDELSLNLDKLSQADTVTIWSGIGLEDQLLKLFVLHVLDRQNILPNRVEIKQFYSVPGYEEPATSLAVLLPDDIRQPDETVVLTKADINFFSSIWSAYASLSPHQLISVLSSSIDDVMLKPLRTLIRRYPSLGNGLNYWENRALETVNRHRQMREVLSIFLNLDTEGYDFVNDVYCRYLLGQLADCGLLKILGDLDDFQTQLELTELGQSVLNKTNKIERTKPLWVGGVMVSSNSINWFAEDNYTRLVEVSV